jgi:hypothetical protein
MPTPPAGRSPPRSPGHPARIQTRLDAGSMRLAVPTTTYAVEGSTPPRAGRVTVDVPTDPASPRQIYAHISRGDIQIVRR